THQALRQVVVCGPRALDSPCRMELFETCLERLGLVHLKTMIEPSPHSDRRHGGGARLHPSWHLQKGSEGRDVVSPENLLEVDEVLFREKSAGPGRAIIDATHHNGKAVGCGRYPDVGPERTQLAADFVAHVQ